MGRAYRPSTLTYLQMGNLRLGEINNLPRAAEQVSRRAGIYTQVPEMPRASPALLSLCKSPYCPTRAAALPQDNPQWFISLHLWLGLPVAPSSWLE